MLEKEYKISSPSQELNPEETLADSFSGYESMEMPIPPAVFKVFGWIVLGGLLVLFFSAFKLQIIEGDNFAELALRNSALPYAVSPPRGIVYDRNGEVVVRNTPSFDLVVVSRELDRDKIPQLALTLSGILDENPNQLKKDLEKSKKESVFFLRTGMDKKSVIDIENLGIKGLYTVANAVRDYVYGAKMSHVIGYVSKVSPEDLRGDTYYRTTDIVGKLGIEAAYEKTLRGDHGAVVFQKEFDSYVFQEPQIGHGLVLSIDAGLQEKIYDVIRTVLAQNSLTRAAAVAQDPNTGEILALVSFPSFDNNAFVDSLSEEEYERYFENSDKPMFNRVISGKYNPGSTIKPLLALAALEERVADPYDIVLSTGQISIANQFDPNIVYVYHDWKPHGWVDMKRAIANSSNIYFYTIGGGYGDIEGLGLERIRKYLKFFLADETLGIDIQPEASGFIPNEEWKLQTFGEPWYKGDTFNISIGQGDLLVTPLWLNAYTAAIANGGAIYKPRVVKSIIDEGKNVIEEFEPEVIGELPIKPETFDVVKEGMREAVLSGTAKSLGTLNVSAAAKTGTAQLGSSTKKINSVFNVFAPYEEPKIVLTILIERVPNQNLATAVAKEVLGWYFSQSKNMIK